LIETVGGSNRRHTMANRSRVVLLALLPVAAGCSLSASSESLSASVESSSNVVSSPFESSASSLKSAETRYREDVRDHTVSFVRSGGDVAAFQAELAEVARQRGITDWEASNATWEGIGEGLARAGVSGADFESRLVALTGSDPAKMATARAAYDRAKK
jgi:hypothetical protein